MNWQYPITALLICILVGAGIYTGFTYTDSDRTSKDGDQNLDENKSSNGQTNNSNQNYSNLNNLSLADCMNNFSFNLYHQICEDYTGNIFYSPYSVYVALAMTYEGARNTTAEEMQDVLGIPRDNDTILKSMETMYTVFNQNSSYNLSTANALWIKENYQLLQEYINLITEYYHGKTSRVDFSKPTEAAEIINSWVENQTNNKIQNLISPSAIDDLTRLILTNAIYFNGTWQTQFDPKNITDREFTLSNGTEIKVPTMKLEGNSFNYTETDNLQVLELPYSGGDLSMIVLLPKNNDLEKVSIDAEKLSNLIQSLNPRKVNIYLPRMKIETKYSLKQSLSNMGMSNAFTKKADFSGINGTEDLFIYDVIHKAFIEIDEKGTEAAGATGVVIGATSTEPSETVTFNADHPFIFVIQHKETDNLLFMGKVTNPS